MTNDGFREQKLNKRTSQTEIPRVSIRETISAPQISAKSNVTEMKQGKILLWLVVSSPHKYRGTVLPIAANSIIGRHGDIRWHDARMSRKHAEFTMIADPIQPEYELFAIKPHQDRNGTMVNGRRIKDLTPLYENDVIIMGDTRFVVKVLE